MRSIVTLPTTARSCCRHRRIAVWPVRFIRSIRMRPDILFNVNLPLLWNGRAMHSGGGGLGGTVNTSPGEKGSGRFDPQPVTDEYPLTRGYVTFGSDEGHRRGDVSFIYNDEALRNWAGAALKKVSRRCSASDRRCVWAVARVYVLQWRVGRRERGAVHGAAPRRGLRRDHGGLAGAELDVYSPGRQQHP